MDSQITGFDELDEQERAFRARALAGRVAKERRSTSVSPGRLESWGTRASSSSWAEGVPGDFLWGH